MAELDAAMDRNGEFSGVGGRSFKKKREARQPPSRRSRSPRKETQRPLPLTFLVLDLGLDIVDGARGRSRDTLIRARLDQGILSRGGLPNDVH